LVRLGLHCAAHRRPRRLGQRYVANLSVDWYHVSSREGGAGYYVIAFGLLGLI
jgi:hypothetical protein